MNKIYKIKTNSLGNKVVCSELAKNKGGITVASMLFAALAAPMAQAEYERNQIDAVNSSLILNKSDATTTLNNVKGSIINTTIHRDETTKLEHVHNSIVGLNYSGNVTGVYSSLVIGESLQLNGHQEIDAGDRRIYTSIISGDNNVVNDRAYSSIISGAENQVKNVNNVISAGGGNRVSDQNGGLIVGRSNTVNASDELVAVGSTRVNSGVVSGDRNTVIRSYNGLIGGSDNTVNYRSDHSIVGGRWNTANTENSLLTGQGNKVGIEIPVDAAEIEKVTANPTAGFTRQASARNIAGGLNNDFSSTVVKDSIISGQTLQSAVANDSIDLEGSTVNRSILTGLSNQVKYSSDSVMSGRNNKVYSLSHSQLSGQRHNIKGTTHNSNILGSDFSLAENKDFTNSLALGASNNVNDVFSHGIIAGSHSNVSGMTINSMILGEYHEMTDKMKDTILTGSENNIALSEGSIISGKQNNIESTTYSMLGGQANTIKQASNSSIMGAGNTIGILSNSDVSGLNNIISNENGSTSNSIIGGTTNNINTAENRQVTNVLISGRGNTINASNANVANSVLLGGNNTVTDAMAFAMGAQNNLSATGVALGFNNNVSGVGGIAIGSGSKVSVDKGVAIGDGANANRAAGSTGWYYGEEEPTTAPFTSTTAAIAIGDAETNKLAQIIGVAAGTEDTDAVNVAQLKQVTTTIEQDIDELNTTLNGRIDTVSAEVAQLGTTLNNRIDVISSGAEEALAEAKIKTKVHSTDSRIQVVKDENDANQYNLSLNDVAKQSDLEIVKTDLTELDGFANEINENVIELTSEVDKGVVFAADNGSKKYGLGETVKVKGSKNVKTQVSAEGIEVGLADDVEINSITAGGVKVSAQGVDMNNTKVTNLAQGEVSETSTDAVTGAQLHEVKQAVSHNDKRITDNTRRINGLEGRMDRVEKQVKKVNDRRKAGSASALATAGLPQPHKEGQSGIVAGVGQYGKETAVAVGYARVSDNGKWIFRTSATTNTQKEFGGQVGLGYFW